MVSCMIFSLDFELLSYKVLLSNVKFPHHRLPCLPKSPPKNKKIQLSIKSSTCTTTPTGSSSFLGIQMFSVTLGRVFIITPCSCRGNNITVIPSHTPVSKTIRPSEPLLLYVFKRTLR